MAQDKILTEQTELLSRLSGGPGVPTSIMDSLTADQSNIITGANANKLELQRLKNKHSAWTDILKTASGTMGGTNAVMRALKNYILLYNYPPEGLFGAAESDWEGTKMGADGIPITWEEYKIKLRDIKDEATYKTVLTAWLTLERA
jgi:cell wall assembly regulator SMI1